MKAAEVIIVGGGISGLYTAFCLEKADVSYILLEAKSLLGGRIAGQPVSPHSDLSVDLGPTWFWAHQNRLKELLTTLQIDWFEQYSAGEALYHMHPDEVPSRTHNSAGSLTSYRVKGGMQKVIAALAEQAGQTNINTAHAVTSVILQNNKWQVTAVHRGRNQTFAANQLVFAVPPRLIVKNLTPEHYFSDKLVRDLRVQQTWMSSQAKFIGVYKKPFWRENGLAGHAFSHVGPMVEIHDASSTTDAGFALFGFVGLPADVRAHLSDDQLKSRCIAQFGTLFGPEALDVEASYLKDWAKDQWVATEQDVNELPRHAAFSMAQHEEELESLGLHLVASEFAHIEAGYIEGALLAADTALKTIKPPTRNQ